MSKENIPTYFYSYMEATVLIIFQIFFATRGIFLKLRKFTLIFPSFNWGILCHVTRLEQSHLSEKF